VRLDPPSGIIRLTDHYHDLTSDGSNWASQAGAIQGISMITDDGQNTATGFEVQFGLPMLTTVLGEAIEGRLIEIHLAIVDGGLVIGDPIILARGDMSADWIKHGIDSLSIPIAGENMFVDQYDSLMYARTSASQRTRFPTDNGLDDVASMSNVRIEFPGPGTHYFHATLPFMLFLAGSLLTALA
jgi:hypothetical protein